MDLTPGGGRENRRKRLKFLINLIKVVYKELGISPPILKPSHRSDLEVDVVLVSQLKLAKDPIGKIIEFSHQLF